MFEQTWIPFTQVSFAIGFVKSSTVVLKEIKMWNVYENKGVKKECTNFDHESSLDFHLKLTCKFPCETNSKSEFHMKFISKIPCKIQMNWVSCQIYASCANDV